VTFCGNKAGPPLLEENRGDLDQVRAPPLEEIEEIETPLSAIDHYIQLQASSGNDWYK
jgi:hypothetical protein